MREADLYEPVSVFLNLSFAKSIKPNLGTLLPIVSITATAGPQASGTWTRPDLSLLALWKHKYSPTVTLDVYGFEVKTAENCNLTAVHETLAHRRLVNFAFLVWHCPSTIRNSPKFQTIFDNCESYGLGLIVFDAPEKPESYDIVLTASRSEPASDAVDEFIETRFQEHQKEQLLNWIPKIQAK